MTDRKRIFYNEPTKPSFTIEGVIYRGKERTYEVQDQLSNPLKSHEAVNLYNNPEQGYRPASSKLIFAFSLGAYQCREQSDGISDRFRVSLHRNFMRFPAGFTEIARDYEKNRVVHNYGTEDEYEEEGKTRGKDTWFRNITNKSLLGLTLGSENIRQINNVLRWIRGTQGYLRRPLKHITVGKWGVCFESSSDRFLLNCAADLSEEHPYFLVREVKR